MDQNANDRYGAFQMGRHDDLLTALGLAVQEYKQDSDAGTRLANALRALDDPAVWNGWGLSEREPWTS